jgi:protein O-mannosyl-transferase
MIPSGNLPERENGERRAVRIAICVLGFVTIGVYARTFVAPFVFDDIASIVNNASIRQVWSTTVLSPPDAEGATVGGRPLLNFTFALNHALSGDAVWSYHAANLLIHLCNGLLLFGLLRRTLRRSAASAPFRQTGPTGAAPREAKPNPLFVAFIIAALWLLHPLQTESVAYVAQRAESLVSFFYLLTLYAFVRAVEAPDCTNSAIALSTPRPGSSAIGWLTGAVAACSLGMATKEVMVTAPIVVLLYDRTFVAGSFRRALRARPAFYAALAATWLLLGALIVSTGGARGDTAGLGTSLSPLAYALTQCRALVHYLRLVFWPSPLVFDYGNAIVARASEVWPQILLVVALLVATVIALRRRPAVGFLAASFFLLLVPSSSIVPIASQTMAEHRMYLPLAALVTLAVLGGCAWLDRAGRILAIAAVVGCAATTFVRTAVYESDLALWSDTVAHAPQNARAHSNLGNAFLERGDRTAAIRQYETALQLRPDYADAHNNLGRALAQSGRAVEAVSHYEAALRVKPASVDVLTNYGSALAQTGRSRAALAIYAHALELEPTAIGPRYDRGNAHFQLGEWPDAASDYTAVLQRQPTHVDARFNLAAALVKLGRIAEAIAQYEAILRLTPNDAATHAELANLLAHLNRTDEAITHYETALRLKPDFAVAREQLTRLRAGRTRE